MCLSKITKRITKPTATIYHGYKGLYIRKSGNKTSVELSFRYWKRRLTLPTGKWLKAETVPLTIYDNGDTYSSGWHCMKTKKAAERWGIPLKVDFRRVRTIGRQNDDLCYVADELYIYPPE